MTQPRSSYDPRTAPPASHLGKMYTRPPFVPDFDTGVHKLLRKGWSTIDLASVTFSPNIFYQTNLHTDLFRAIDSEGKAYILKVFRDPQSDTEYVSLAHRNIARIAQDPSFVKRVSGVALSAHSNRRKSHFIYLTEHVDAPNLKDRLLEEEYGKDTSTLVGSALAYYASVMDTVHSSGCVLGDVSLGSILVGDSWFRFCDYDFITPQENLHDGVNYPFTPAHASQEHWLRKRPTVQGDLESFALMIHHLVIGSMFMPLEVRQDYFQMRRLAQDNLRHYDPSCEEQLPPHLREIIPSLVSYPRNNDITLEDLASAIRADFPRP